MCPLRGLISSKHTENCLNGLGGVRTSGPPYSPDLAPSDFHLFGPLKKLLGGITFENGDAVKQHVLKFLHSTGKDFYAAGFMQLVER